MADLRLSMMLPGGVTVIFLGVIIWLQLPTVAPANSSRVVAPSRGQADTFVSPWQQGSQDQEIEALIVRLGSDDFDQRQAASNRLLEIGDPALDILKRYRHVGDSEIRLQVLRISRIIVRDRINRQIESFLADPEGSLPGWDMFADLYEDSGSNRQLYATLFRQRSKSMAVADADAENRLKEINELLAEFDQRRSTRIKPHDELLVTISFLFATFFMAPPNQADADTDFNQMPVRLQMDIRTIFDSVPIEEVQNLDAAHRTIEKTIELWIASPDKNLNVTPARLALARSRNLKSGLIPATVCLNAREMATSYRRDAIDTIARFGDETHFELLERFLDNDAHVFRTTRHDRRGERYTLTTQIRDVALAALVHLAGQSYTEYGFDIGYRTNQLEVLPYTLAGFRSDEERQAAIDRWRDMRARSNIP